MRLCHTYPVQRLVGTPEGHPGSALDAAYMREALLGDGPGLIDDDIGGSHRAALAHLSQLVTDVEPFVVHRTAEELYLDIKDGALGDGLVDRPCPKDYEVLAPVIPLSARRGFAIHA